MFTTGGGPPSREHLANVIIPSPPAATKEQEQNAKLELAARRADQARLQAEKDTKERERTALERRERDLADRERKLKLKEAAAASRATGSSKVNPPVMKTAKVKEPKRPPFNLSKVR